MVMILKNNKTIDEEKEKGLLSEQEAKILIVDDEKDIRKLVGIYLKKQGYKTLEAENGQMAIDIMKEHSDIDLVIMDIMMPVSKRHLQQNETGSWMILGTA